MSEDLSQKISQFLDDDLNHDEAMHLLHTICLQPEMQNKLKRFEAISYALKTGDYVPPKTGFTEAVRLQVQQEPNYFLPQYKQRNQTLKHWAMAASILGAAVLVGYSLNEPASVAPLAAQAVSLESNPAPASASVATNPVMVVRQIEQKPLNARINDYLQAHKSSVYANEDNQYRPLARVTAYSQK